MAGWGEKWEVERLYIMATLIGLHMSGLEYRWSGYLLLCLPSPICCTPIEQNGNRAVDKPRHVVGLLIEKGEARMMHHHRRLLGDAAEGDHELIQPSWDRQRPFLNWASRYSTLFDQLCPRNTCLPGHLLGRTSPQRSCRTKLGSFFSLWWSRARTPCRHISPIMAVSNSGSVIFSWIARFGWVHHLARHRGPRADFQGKCSARAYKYVQSSRYQYKFAQSCSYGIAYFRNRSSAIKSSSGGTSDSSACKLMYGSVRPFSSAQSSIFKT